MIGLGHVLGSEPYISRRSSASYEQPMRSHRSCADSQAPWCPSSLVSTSQPDRASPRVWARWWISATKLGCQAGGSVQPG